MFTLKSKTTEIILEVERLLEDSQVSDRVIRFDLIVEGEGQCKLYQDPFMIVLLVMIDDTEVRTYQASDRVFRTPDAQCEFLLFSREVAGVQRSIEHRFNRFEDLLCPA